MSSIYFIGVGLMLGKISAPSSPLATNSCFSSISATAPDSRYTNNGDSTITDNQTGLMWKQCSEGLGTTTTACDSGAITTHTWQGALQQVQTVNGSGFASHTDWRLPNRNELASLVERSCNGPAINATYFPDIVSGTFWSSSTYAGDSLHAWGVDFNVGTVRNHNKTSVLSSIRLVRGGQ